MRSFQVVIKADGRTRVPWQHVLVYGEGEHIESIDTMRYGVESFTRELLERGYEQRPTMRISGREYRRIREAYGKIPRHSERTKQAEPAAD